MYSLEQITGYRFGSAELARQALCHSSARGQNEHRSSYERLEFLGDAILNLVTSEELLRRLPDASEGDLSKVRSRLVSTAILAKLSNHLGLNALIEMGKGYEEFSPERIPESIQADIIESIIAAVYLDGGWAPAQGLCRLWLQRMIDFCKTEGSWLVEDAKTMLQEWTQADRAQLPDYEVIEEMGPPHQKVYRVQVSLNQKPLAAAQGQTKKKAEQAAALKALMSLGVPLKDPMLEKL